MAGLSLGIIGLGKMGSNLALQAAEKGIAVVGKDKGNKPELSRLGIKVVDEYKLFFRSLTKPRVVFLSLPAGELVDEVLADISGFLEKGDVVLDGGNSFYKDSVRRHEKVNRDGVYYLDCGTSGGVDGARHGACFMVGGDKEGFKAAELVLNVLAVKGGVLHTGPSGSGHFVKLVHNGIEFGMLQAIGEGVELLTGGDYRLDLRKVFRNWSNGSVIRGWLVELMEQGLKEMKLGDVDSYVEDTGEVNWLVADALDREIPVPVIAQSVMELFRSREKRGDAYRAIALMRHGFGGHPLGPDKNIAKERRTSRIAAL